MKLAILVALAWAVGCLPAPSAALTVEEVLLLKQNGVSEETIQMMLQSEMEAERRAAANDRMGIRTIVRPGGKPAIVYSTGSGAVDTRTAEERLREERAWDMLRHIIVDTRDTQN